jgi:hypothetical protein
MHRTELVQRAQDAMLQDTYPPCHPSPPETNPVLIHKWCVTNAQISMPHTALQKCGKEIRHSEPLPVCILNQRKKTTLHEKEVENRDHVLGSAYIAL